MKEDYPARRAEIEAQLEVLEAEKEQLEAELMNIMIMSNKNYIDVRKFAMVGWRDVTFDTAAIGNL